LFLHKYLLTGGMLRRRLMYDLPEDEQLLFLYIRGGDALEL